MHISQQQLIISYMQIEPPTEAPDTAHARKDAKKANDQIIEEQNFILGCDEMERITDDIIVPVILNAAQSVRDSGKKIDVVLMDCESPIDEMLYNCGIRFVIGDSSDSTNLTIIADPSSFFFTLTVTGTAEESHEIEEEIPFYELTPRWLTLKVNDYLAKHAPDCSYSTALADFDASFEQLTPPFTVRFDDGNSISDVAKTESLKEAIKMGGTFAQMFKDESKVSIIDSKDTTIC